ncbi:hypothetical protein AbraIFM66951_006536 [Aspergillus brasiliensis]|uniref:Uncharacterized protein n=1 Tax=Aspergillus brasiliensis TaxID=319629 RepID=A0A9W6DJV1_9EURO|nr:hypothetical protein AbraCBS73388_011521 [Aspergillus brasiliensis]GKZ44375.1 hypothetical protein AbraIFM66951_006536 [Aspergillus brasiliensis]
MVKYDIPTLLALSHNGRIDFSKFSEQAVGNNVLRQRKTSTSVLSEQPVNRSRNTSNLSRQSERTLSIPEHSVFHPSRQPSDPPQSIRAHADAGFAQFLKEHTSPKHQRVTAGGRIVPMEPQSPTPKAKQPVRNISARADDPKLPKPSKRDDNRNKRENKQVLLPDNNASVDISIAAPQFAESHDNIRTILPQGAIDQHFSSCGQAPGLLSTAATTGLFSQPSLPWAMDNLPMPQIGLAAPDIMPAASDYPMYAFGDGPLSWTPNMYSTLGTQGPVIPSMPTVQPYPNVTSSSDLSMDSNTSSGRATSFLGQLPPSYDSLCPSLGLQCYPYAGGPVPALNQAMMVNTPQAPTYQKSLEDAAKEHESLTSKLSGIDRYMAVHSWDLDPSAKKILVDQRMSLVRELDAVRMYREHLEWVSGRLSTTIPIKQHASNVPPVYVTSSLTGSPALMGPSLCAPSSTSALPAFSMLPLANAFSQSLSLNETVNSQMPPHAVADPHSYSTAISQTDVRPSHNSTKNVGFAHAARGIETRVEPKRSDKQVQTYGEARSRTTDGTAGWKTPTKISASDVEKVHHKIEEATRRGEPLDGLLRELSAATSQLIKQRRDELYEPRGLLSAIPARQSRKNRAESEACATKGQPDKYEAHAPLMRHSTKAWKPGKELRRPGLHSAMGPFISAEEVEEGDDCQSTSSYVSTTDSWATVHQGERRRDRKRRKSKEKRANREMAERYKPRGRLEHPIVSEAAFLPGPQRSKGQNLGAPGGPPIYKPRSPPTLVNPTDSARQTSVEDMKRQYPQLLTQYFTKDRGLGFQKTAALAVSQNVNAHGFLPPFEGVGNAPSKTRSAPTDMTEGGIYLFNGKTTGSKQHDGPGQRGDDAPRPSKPAGKP